MHYTRCVKFCIIIAAIENCIISHFTFEKTNLSLNMLSRSCTHFNLCKLYVRTLRTVPCQQIKIKIIPPRQKETHGTKNRRLGRFMAPNLSIYKPQLTSIMSISNRACSILLSIYTWGLGIGALISSHDNAHFVTMLDGLQLGSTSLFILKFLIAFPFSYHLCASTRVLIWETGSFLSLKGIYGTGYVALVTTILTTIGLASLYAITRSLIRSSALRQGIHRIQVAAPSRQVTLKVVPAAEAIQTETYDEKNQRLGRELSPHLTIYKPQLTSMLSITHRGTGFALTGYAWALGLGALMSSHDISHYVTIIEGLHLGSATLVALKFALAFPLAFHSCCGVRHLLWDTGRFLKITEVYLTGYVTLGISFVLSAILACL